MIQRAFCFNWTECSGSIPLDEEIQMDGDVMAGRNSDLFFLLLRQRLEEKPLTSFSANDNCFHFSYRACFTGTVLRFRIDAAHGIRKFGTF